jgi:type II secretory pathway pseudopilin PulG
MTKLGTFLRAKDTQHGYTLVELLLYIALVGTLLTSVTYFFSLSVDSRVKNQSIAEVNDQGAAVMDRITQTIRNASSVTSPVPGTTASSLTLVVPTGALSPTVFNLNSTTLQITEGANSAVALTSDEVQVTNLTFKNLTRTGTNANIQISFTLSRTNPSGRNTYDYQKTFISSAGLSW